MVDNMGASLCNLFLLSHSVCTWRMNSCLLMIDYCLGHLYLWLDASDVSQFLMGSHDHMAIWCPQLDARPPSYPTAPPGIVFRGAWLSAAGGTAILQNARGLCYDCTIRASHNFYETSLSITAASYTKGPIKSWGLRDRIAVTTVSIWFRTLFCSELHWKLAAFHVTRSIFRPVIPGLKYAVSTFLDHGWCNCFQLNSPESRLNWDEVWGTKYVLRMPFCGINTCEREKEEEVWAKGEVSLQCKCSEHIAKPTRKYGKKGSLRIFPIWIEIARTWSVIERMPPQKGAWSWERRLSSAETIPRGK